MTSRERVQMAISLKEPDRVPIDLGGTSVTGISAFSLVGLKKALGIKTPVMIDEPFQMLGKIDDELRKILGIDTVPLNARKNFFGFENKNWKKWTAPDGTEFLVPEKFNTTKDDKGNVYLYPEGDTTVLPSGKLPASGFYFDAIIRQKPIDEANLNPSDNVDVELLKDEDLRYYETEATRLYKETEFSIIANFGGTSFGDIALVPGPFLKNPGGIRDIEEWYVSTIIRRNYVYEVFSRQCEIALQNLKMISEAVGNKIDVIFVSGTDFGTQNSQFISVQTYRELYKPFHSKVNGWIHKNTNWKTFIHSCGSIEPFINDFIEAGFDILNPIQCSAANMDPYFLKQKYGRRICFWGGGIDTQKTLPFGTPEKVKEEVKNRLTIFSKEGGYVFNTIHNIQAKTPVENILSMFEAVKQFNNKVEEK